MLNKEIQSEFKIDVCIPSLSKKEKDFYYLKEFIPINNIFVSNLKGLANARNDLIRKATTEWFLFLDDDIILNKKWWEKIKKFRLSNKTGALNGFALPKSFLLIILRHILFLRGLKSQRGFTSNTLIRKKAAAGAELKQEGRLEDMELQNKIKANGYEWRFCFAYCRHTKNPSKIFKEAINDFNKIRKEKGLLKALFSI